LRLAELLNAWPGQVASRPQSLSLAPGAVSISVVLDDDATPFLRVFTPPTGWSVDEPRINSADSKVRLHLQLRTPEAKP
jgi:hypothetical protein